MRITNNWMQKKVILPVINDLVTDQRMHKVCTALHQNGYEVLLVGARRKHSKSLAPRLYQTDRFPLIFEKGKIYYVEFTIRLFFYLLKKKAHIITANDLDTLLPSYLVSKIKGSELIYDSHEYFTELPELNNRLLTKKVWLAMERFLFPKLQKVMTVNDSIAKIYASLYHKDIKVVRNVPFRLHEIPKLVKDNIVIYQGNVNKGRGIDTMLHALRLLEGVEFWCVGPGDLLQEMKDLAHELGVMHKVKFWGGVPFQELKDLTVKAKIGISIEQPIGLNATLCLPNKLMDYIQCHLPVIVTDLPEMANLVTKYDNGIVLKEHSPQALATAIQQILANEDLSQKYERNSAQAAKELCWENEQQTLLDLYQS